MCQVYFLFFFFASSFLNFYVSQILWLVYCDLRLDCVWVRLCVCVCGSFPFGVWDFFLFEYFFFLSLSSAVDDLVLLFCCIPTENFELKFFDIKQHIHQARTHTLTQLAFWLKHTNRISYFFFRFLRSLLN